MSTGTFNKWLVTLAAGVLLSMGGAAHAGIAATKHNLSTSHSAAGQTIYSSDQPEICIFCHTPHDAIKNDNIPLWNHALSATAAYGVYTSPTFDSTDEAEVGGVTAATAAVTNLCLSCHDGTVAINSFNNPSNINPTTTMVGTTGDALPAASSTNLGTDLKNDHPINFTFNTALATADGFLVDPVDAAGSGLAPAKLFNGKVQCASCHDPHTSDQGAFLRTHMNGSQLCMECHSK